MSSIWMENQELQFVRGLKYILIHMKSDESLHYFSDELDSLRQSNNNVCTLNSFHDADLDGFVSSLTREEEIMYMEFLLLAYGEEI